jgi:hypothetical protein
MAEKKVIAMQTELLAQPLQEGNAKYMENFLKAFKSC